MGQSSRRPDQSAAPIAQFGLLLSRAGAISDHLGGVEIQVLDPSAEAIPGTMTTAVITCFRIGRLDGGRDVGWAEARPPVSEDDLMVLVTRRPIRLSRG
jgi:hypothetical protein